MRIKLGTILIVLSVLSIVASKGECLDGIRKEVSNKSIVQASNFNTDRHSKDTKILDLFKK